MFWAHFDDKCMLNKDPLYRFEVLEGFAVQIKKRGLNGSFKLRSLPKIALSKI
jgi:hypothetical protein